MEAQLFSQSGELVLQSTGIKNSLVIPDDITNGAYILVLNRDNQPQIAERVILVTGN